MAVGPANALGDMGIAGACGEHDFDGHVVEFENLQLAALAEFGYLLCINSKNSSVCHSSMHAPSLARGIDGAGGGECELAGGVGVGSLLQGSGTARLDGLLHDVVRALPACGNSRIHGLLSFMIVHMLSGAPLPIHVRSVVLNLGREQSGRGGVLWARSGKMLGKILLSLSSCQERCMSPRWQDLLSRAGELSSQSGPDPWGGLAGVKLGASQSIVPSDATNIIPCLGQRGRTSRAPNPGLRGHFALGDDARFPGSPRRCWPGVVRSSASHKGRL